MRRSWGYIGGGIALVVIGAAATRPDLLEGFRAEAPAPLVVAAALPAPPAPPAEDPARAAATEAEIARLTAALATEEAENARLRTTLTVRDAVLASLQANLTERETALDGLQAALAASTAEIDGLRAELAGLRAAPQGLEPTLADWTSEATPSAARLETLRAGPADLDAAFAAIDAAKSANTVLAALAPVALASVDGAPTDGVMVEIHFDSASSRLTPGGRAYAAAAAASLSGQRIAGIRVTGHTDRVGSPAANRRLAMARARAVAEFLVAAGIPAALIETTAAGETELPVATADGVAEPLNRSAAIIALPLPTS